MKEGVGNLTVGLGTYKQAVTYGFCASVQSITLRKTVWAPSSKMLLKVINVYYSFIENSFQLLYWKLSLNNGGNTVF